MSVGKVELVRRAMAFLNGDVVEPMLELCQPDFRLDMSERVFNPEVYEGHDGIRRFHGEVRDVWVDYRWDVEELIDAGDEVVALLRAHGRGRGSGLEIDRHIAMVWELASGQLVSVRLYADQGRALEAVDVAS